MDSRFNFDPNKRLVKVLSLDGGGIRGIIPATVLNSIELKTGKPIAECFDFIAGTSTGGILASALASKNKIKAKEALNIYMKEGSKIFSRTALQKIWFFSSLSDTKYSHNGLKTVLEQYLEEETIDEVRTKLLMPAYDIHNREAYVFKSWKKECVGVPLTTACMATAAAPTYFPPVHTFIQGKERTFIDGGVYMNNPAVSAYVEVKRYCKEVYGDEDVEVFMLSIGTGQLTRSLSYDTAKNWGKIEWIAPLIDCMFDGDSDAVEYQMNMLLGDNYVRLQVRDLDEKAQEMDSTDSDNLKNLKVIADRLVKGNAELLTDICDILK